jgi:diguanylate cyclase (GGDEF)-like protein
VLDVDHFKQVNDHWGHAIGDQLLCHLARLLTQFFPDAMIARFGGEEFALMVPHCPFPCCSSGWKGFACKCASNRCPEISLFVRASFGVINVGRLSMDEALSEADRQLYQAKNTGRDKIVCQDV